MNHYHRLLKSETALGFRRGGSVLFQPPPALIPRTADKRNVRASAGAS